MAAAGQAVAPATAEKTRVAEATDNKESGADDPRWGAVLDLPCRLTVDLPLPHFKVTDFLKLQVGLVIGTGWRLSHDVPLRVNGTLIGWGEFEGTGNRLAVRVTELA